MNILNKSMIGLVSICGCCTMRVGQRKLRPEVSVASEEYKKQFQTSKEILEGYITYRDSYKT